MKLKSFVLQLPCSFVRCAHCGALDLVNFLLALSFLFIALGIAFFSRAFLRCFHDSSEILYCVKENGTDGLGDKKDKSRRQTSFHLERKAPKNEEKQNQTTTEKHNYVSNNNKERKGE